MRLTSLIVASAALVGLGTVSASAQAVPPRWNYQGSAVCPDGYDYYARSGLCMARGGYRYGPRYDGGYGEGIPPRWNYRGSAVCPQGYDYHAHVGLCLPQRY